MSCLILRVWPKKTEQYSVEAQNPVVNSELSPPLAFKFEARGELQFRMLPQVESVPAFCLIPTDKHASDLR